MAETLAAINFPRSVLLPWPCRRPRSWSPHRIATGPKGQSRSLFPERYDAGDGAPRSAGAYRFPTTIYYAFKQSESRNDRGVSRTGWETFLEALISAGFGITGTWPMRTELANRMIGMGSNALASSVVLVCRKRSADAPIATRRDFIAALKAELPPALVHLQRGNIAPVDLAQAAIGPGMAVYTSYAKVLDASGNRVSVGEALALINQTLDETLAEQEGDFDADSRWALAWFEQHGFDEGDYGIAETLSTAKNTSVSGMVEAGDPPFARRQGSVAAAGMNCPPTGTLRKMTGSPPGRWSIT